MEAAEKQSQNKANLFVQRTAFSGLCQDEENNFKNKLVMSKACSELGRMGRMEPI
jgi:hypothetical protein